MRLSDLDFRKVRSQEIQTNKNLGTREVSLTGKEIVEAMKMDSSLAREKIEKIPEETREQLRPFFSPSFYKVGPA